MQTMKKFDWEYFRDAGMVFLKDKKGKEDFKKFLKIVKSSGMEMKRFKERMETMGVIENFKEAISEYYEDKVEGFEDLLESDIFYEFSKRFFMISDDDDFWEKEKRKMKSIGFRLSLNYLNKLALGIIKKEEKFDSYFSMIMRLGGKNLTEATLNEFYNEGKKAELFKSITKNFNRELIRDSSVENFKKLFPKYQKKCKLVYLIKSENENKILEEYSEKFLKYYFLEVIEKESGEKEQSRYSTKIEKLSQIMQVLNDKSVFPGNFETQINYLKQIYYNEIFTLNQTFLDQLLIQSEFKTDDLKGVFELHKYFLEIKKKYPSLEVLEISEELIKKLKMVFMEEVFEYRTLIYQAKTRLEHLLEIKKIFFNEKILENNPYKLLRTLRFLTSIFFKKRLGGAEPSDPELEGKIKELTYFYVVRIKEMNLKKPDEDDGEKLKFYQEVKLFEAFFGLVHSNFPENSQDYKFEDYFLLAKTEHWNYLSFNFWDHDFYVFNSGLFQFFEMFSKEIETSMREYLEIEFASDENKTFMNFYLKKIFFDFLVEGRFKFENENFYVNMTNYKCEKEYESLNKTTIFNKRGYKFFYSTGFIKDEITQWSAVEFLKKNKEIMKRYDNGEFFYNLAKLSPELIKKYPELHLRQYILVEPSITGSGEASSIDKKPFNSAFYPGGSESFILNYRTNPKEMMNPFSLIYFNNDLKTGIIGLETENKYVPKSIISKSIDSKTSQWEIYLNQIRRKDPWRWGVGYEISGYLLAKIMDRGEFSKDIIGVIEVMLLGDDPRGEEDINLEEDEEEMRIGMMNLFASDSEEGIEEKRWFTKTSTYKRRRKGAHERSVTDMQINERETDDPNFTVRRKLYSLKIFSVKTRRFMKNYNLARLNLNLENREKFRLVKSSDGSLQLFFIKYDNDIRFLDLDKTGGDPQTGLEFHQRGIFAIHPEFILDHIRNYSDFEIVNYGKIYCAARIKNCSNDRRLKKKIKYVSIYQKIQGEFFLQRHIEKKMFGNQMVLDFALIDENMILLVMENLDLICYHIEKNKFEKFRSPYFSSIAKLRRVHTLLKFDRERRKLLFSFSYQKSLGSDFTFSEGSQDFDQILSYWKNKFGEVEKRFEIHPEENERRRRIFAEEKEEEGKAYLKGCFCCGVGVEVLDLKGIF